MVADQIVNPNGFCVAASKATCIIWTKAVEGFIRRPVSPVCLQVMVARTQVAQSVEDLHMSLLLPFWQRLFITVAAMLVASYFAGLAWGAILSFPLPSYAAGVVGGLAALPIWDFLKRVRPSQE